MWGSWTRTPLYIAVLGLMMWLLAKILSPILDAATSGPYASDSSVQTIAEWFGYLTVPNLTLAAGAAIVVWLIGQAVTEKRIGG